jgi:hypothetical protein
MVGIRGGQQGENLELAACSLSHGMPSAMFCCSLRPCTPHRPSTRQHHTLELSLHNHELNKDLLFCKLPGLRYFVTASENRQRHCHLIQSSLLFISPMRSQGSRRVARGHCHRKAG